MEDIGAQLAWASSIMKDEHRGWFVVIHLTGGDSLKSPSLNVPERPRHHRTPRSSMEICSLTPVRALEVRGTGAAGTPRGAPATW